MCQKGPGDNVFTVLVYYHCREDHQTMPWSTEIEMLMTHFIIPRASSTSRKETRTKLPLYEFQSHTTVSKTSLQSKTNVLFFSLFYRSMLHYTDMICANQCSLQYVCVCVFMFPNRLFNYLLHYLSRSYISLHQAYLSLRNECHPGN